MRVLTVSPMPPERDGIATYTARLSDALRREGHTVGHVTTSVDQSDVDRVATLTLKPLAVRQVVGDAFAWRPDVVHVQHAIAAYGPLLPALLCLLRSLRRREITVLITHHEVTRDTDRLGRVGRSYYALVSRLASRVHVHTAEAAERLAACGVDPRRIVTSFHPVFGSEPGRPDAAARLRRKYAASREHVLLLIGYIQVEKGHPEAIEALARLLARRPDLRPRLALVVAGEVRARPTGFAHFEKADRAYEARVRAQVVALGLDDVVHWTGHVPEGDFASWFAAADLVLLPYAAAEESGIAGHAIAAGCPVLAAPVGGLRTLFGGTVLELPSRDPDCFSAALERAIDAPEAMRAQATRVYDALRAQRAPARLAGIVAETGGAPR